MAAVDAAAKALPVKQLEDLVFIPDNYGGGKAPDEPPNRGKKVRARWAEKGWLSHAVGRLPGVSCPLAARACR